MQLSITPRFVKSPVGIKGNINERQQLKEGGPDEQRTPLPAWGQVTHTRGCSNNDERVQQVHLQGNPGLSCTNVLDQARWLQCGLNPPVMTTWDVLSFPCMAAQLLCRYKLIFPGNNDRTQRLELHKQSHQLPHQSALLTFRTYATGPCMSATGHTDRKES